MERAKRRCDRHLFWRCGGDQLKVLVDYLAPVWLNPNSFKYPSCSCGDGKATIQGSASIKPKKERNRGEKQSLDALLTLSCHSLNSWTLIRQHVTPLVFLFCLSTDLVSPSRNCRSSLKALCPTLRPVRESRCFSRFTSSLLHLPTSSLCLLCSRERREGESEPKP